jgi:hypothetical protein
MKPPATAHFAARFGDIVRGLLSLEINTIVKEGMTATRMGRPLEALGQIALDYATWLQAHGGAPLLFVDPVTASQFESLATAAGALAGKGDQLALGVKMIASRIQNNARHLSQIFNEITSGAPDPDELVQLRKIWEIGTEEVVMQTVLWIDGDATHRIHPAYADKAHEPLLQMHSASVGVSLSYWKSLSELIMSLFQSAWQHLTSR